MRMEALHRDNYFTVYLKVIGAISRATRQSFATCFVVDKFIRNSELFVGIGLYSLPDLHDLAASRRSQLLQLLKVCSVYWSL